MYVIGDLALLEVRRVRRASGEVLIVIQLELWSVSRNEMCRVCVPRAIRFPGERALQVLT